MWRINVFARCSAEAYMRCYTRYVFIDIICKHFGIIYIRASRVTLRNSITKMTHIPKHRAHLAQLALILLNFVVVFLHRALNKCLVDSRTLLYFFFFVNVKVLFFKVFNWKYFTQYNKYMCRYIELINWIEICLLSTGISKLYEHNERCAVALE